MKKVDKKTIDALMDQVTYKYTFIDESTLICSSHLNNFTIATALNSCVDPNQFNVELGKQYSLEECKRLTEEKLWEFEGYCLAKSLKLANDQEKQGFRLYKSKPVTRIAKQIKDGGELTNISDGFYRYFDDEIEVPVLFKSHEAPVVGGYIVFLTEEDIYYCNKEVFEERNEV